MADLTVKGATGSGEVLALHNIGVPLHLFVTRISLAETFVDIISPDEAEKFSD